MKQQAAAELLLQRMNRLSINNGFFGATDGTIGNVNVLQKDMNRALGDWRNSKDTTGLRQMTATLQVMGRLTDTEYEQIMEALDGEK